MPKDDEEVIEVRCPECNATVKLTRDEAEREYQAKCPNGHEIPLAKAL
ncbi:MAG TPA: hypothetical protein VM580_11230 [Labilithrix sp.]|jgi:hypothetical protein|nr:hypothetical protein [Labilithrix sp.]